MKRSFLMSALVLGLATGMAACGGGAAGTDGPASPDGPKTDDGSNDDPVVALQKISDGIQKDVDAIIAPIKDADAVLDAISKLPADIKASSKAKFDAKKLMAEAGKIVNGADADIDSLGLDADVKVKVTERFGKLKDLVAAVKNVDQAVKDLGSKITDALPKIPALGAKALAKAEVTLKNPLAGADSKKQAQADKDKITAIIDGFKTKASGWQSDLTALPAKAKDIPKKIASIVK
jgi:hypothetical protein